MQNAERGICDPTWTQLTRSLCITHCLHDRFSPRIGSAFRVPQSAILGPIPVIDSFSNAVLVSNPDMTDKVHLVVETGRHKGMQIRVGPEGARLGRSSKNDVVLLDPLLSRHHCRLFFKPGEGLWIADLGSANQTFVNDEPAQELRLKPGDKISVGDTILRALSTTEPGIEEKDVVTSVVDLGLGTLKEKPRGKTFSTQSLIVAACIVILLALGIWVPKLMKKEPKVMATPPAQAQQVAPCTLEIDYEKVLADGGNIFRYHLKIDKDGTIAVQIDDLENDRHLRKEAAADKDYLASLARAIDQSGFFTLDENYQGIQPDIFNLWDLTVTIGKQTHRSKVMNRVEPEIFREVREIIEEAGKNELGLWAIQFSPETLLTMSGDAHLLGKKLFDEREVRYGNLAAALKSFEEAEWYLETLEPKPDYYGEIVSFINNCKEALQQKYEDQNFRAERAIRLRDWNSAANELRILCEIIPDRSDPRNKESRRKLLDVENRLEGLK